MNSKTIEKIIDSVITIALVYSAISFVELELNASYWDTLSRIVFVILSTIFAVVIWADKE